MTPKRKQKLLLISLMLGALSLAIGLTLYALSANINLFYSPTQIAQGEAPQDREIRAGGMVVEGSVERDPNSLKVRFAVTDFAEEVWITYDKILPDLFREGQGVVAVGRLNAAGELVASQVVARHDENYMPPEVAEALKAAGQMPDHSPFQRPAAEQQY
ncbi:cytochrome c maturation protein CcmE [Marinospirillum alkaliphilum]|uniref:Cytochrome c-type biogenesis protein CcmE n=1 Tax=Marinospirillum alkaliphilum DSM 21637 TaxID=1122209 RepID=A0A1K1VCE3_9GAMM|nr:cytochrome c maturation protein CcmE [Marinospirillum alkaliphilum]SFX22806.1 cytochrome c-type biogenesis protein CcmE [Marinospirillum alkaliphilum DSM 21637]